MNLLRLWVIKKPSSRTLIILVVLSIVFIYFYHNDTLYKEQSLLQNRKSISKYSKEKIARELKQHKQIVEKFYEKRKNWKTSNLGSILFKNVQPYIFYNKERHNRQYLILIWRYWNWLKPRHINNFQRKSEPADILEYCSVKNCIYSGNDDDFQQADAVVIHMQHGLTPEVSVRNPNQRWIFLSDESPHNTYSLSKYHPPMANLSGMFNWTMTYRSDSDVPVPYGRTVPLSEPLDVNLEDPVSAIHQLVPFWEKKQFTTLAIIAISNCAIKSRIKLISDLNSYINIEVVGRCSKLFDNKTRSCPGHFRSNCDLINEYIFYLVLENSKCRQYLTEKVFQQAFDKGAIPIIMGAPLEDCVKLLPPNSFLHVDNYDAPEELAMHMVEIASNYDNLLKYHSWRKHFATFAENGYFGTKSYHYCRVCEALNYNDRAEKVYYTDDLELYFDKKVLCDKEYLHMDPF